MPPQLVRQARAVTELNELESAVLNSAREGGTPLATVRADARWAVERIADRLADLGYVLDRERARGTQVIVAMMVFLPVLLGAIKIAVGISRGRPVVYLVIATLATLVVAFLIARRPVHRTSLGDAKLRAMRNRHAALRPKKRGEPSDAIGTAVALFGMDALANSAFAGLHRTLTPPGGKSSASGCGTSCGGGDGGGSGCGGGGCGGCSG